jgi:coenzyme F420-0:L-glutamate ligase / coenzyme F420-1:gamma-L-glutamate ligase
MSELLVLAPDGIPEVESGDDLVALVVTAVPDLADGDIVVIASKVVSKAEGRVVPGHDRLAAIADETVREVARRGDTVIAQTRHGFVMAAAGVDASNVEVGRLVLLPVDPDASARRLRAGLLAATGSLVGVIVTDTFGRPWRHGQTDLAVGAAGVTVLDELSGQIDRYGNPLVVTAAAIADELAGAADLVKSKLSARPLAVVRGLAGMVTPDDGPGVSALIRLGPLDMFRLGSREAVVEAVDRAGVAAGSPASADVDVDVVMADADGPGLDLALLADTLDATGVAEELVLGGDGTVLVRLRSELLELDPLELGLRIGRASVLLAGNGFGLLGRPPELRVEQLRR